jgi:twitching motility two-component system response regulator PilH
VTGPKILVVDDSPTELRLVSALLRAEGYQVVTAADGDEALSRVRSERPELVVLDVILPKKNGFQVCRLLKSAPDTSAIKVLLLTSKSQESDRFWGLRQGADVYLTKPFADEELLDHVARLL